MSGASRQIFAAPLSNDPGAATGQPIMKLHFLSAYSGIDAPSVSEWADGASTVGKHQLTPDPEAADAIVFAETYHGLDPYFFDVIRHPLFRRFPEKCLLYHVSDTCETLCRTISPSVERSQSNLQCRRSFPYLVRIRDNPLVHESWDRSRPAKYLFSFVGAAYTHPLRKRLLELSHPEALLCDPAVDLAGISNAARGDEVRRSYVESILDSSFVLCPRGLGPASMRLFEVMELGRAPVVISDAWIPIPNLPWSDFALFVPEREIGRIPALLEAARPRAREMGRVAREVWEHHYAPDRIFDEFAVAAAELLRHPYGAKERIRDSLALFRSKHWRNLGGYAKRAVFSQSKANALG